MTKDYFSCSASLISLLLTLFFLSCSRLTGSLPIPSATAYGGATWKNNNHSLDFLTPSVYQDALVRPILLSGNISYNDMNLQFGCGFFCYGSPCDTGYLFATFFVVHKADGRLFDMQMVWSSNRDQMVQENAALILSSTGELVLKDADGSLVWSTNTSTQSFQRMEIGESGNLVLYNPDGGIIWQSFDYPTDTILIGQKLKVDQKLIANTSPKNTSEGRFYCTLLHDCFAMFTASAPAKMYFRYPELPACVEFSYAQFDNQSVHIYFQGRRSPSINLSVPKDSLYFKLDWDGNLKVCSILQTIGRYSPDYLPSFVKYHHPRPCGDYGVCTNGQCSCPKDGNAFKPIDAAEPDQGCAPHVPLACSEKSRRQDHHFLELEHVSYFTYLYENSSTPGLVSRDECKRLCLENCSCKAAFFRQQKEKDEDDGEDDHVDWSAGLPLRFTFQELQDATHNFSVKLGRGGFGGKRSRELSEDGLFSLLQIKAEEGRLIDLVYPGLENEETGVKEEAIKLLKLGMWCLQDNFTKRPAMSIVVKALEGLIDTFNDVPCALAVSSDKQPLFSSDLSYAPTTSVISGPR
ncbi:hypothetical protein SUGI_0717660 [Cryptomeria japonica]|nr:hypothetical protein SUGI_0717660 [Cryptomeria japonica]